MVEGNGWERLSEVAPSDQFVCTYGGQFAQTLEINRPLVERFLSISALDGRVLLQESKVRRPRAIPDGVNPDGSVAGRGGLRWGEKLETDEKREINPNCQIEPDENGWVISINGGLIADDLREKGGLTVREMNRKGANRFNGYLADSFSKTLLKDKLTFAKDPFFTGRLLVSSISLVAVTNNVWAKDWGSLINGLLFYELLVFYTNIFRKSFFDEHLSNEKRFRAKNYDASFMKIINFHRRTVRSFAEGFDTPFEIDRLIGALGYLEWNRLTRNRLVRAAS